MGGDIIFEKKPKLPLRLAVTLDPAKLLYALPGPKSSMRTPSLKIKVEVRARG